MIQRLPHLLVAVLACFLVLGLTFLGLLVAGPQRFGQNPHAPARAAAPQAVGCEEAMNRAIAAAMDADRAVLNGRMMAQSFRSLAWSAIYDAVCR